MKHHLVTIWLLVGLSAAIGWGETYKVACQKPLWVPGYVALTLFGPAGIVFMIGGSPACKA